MAVASRKEVGDSVGPYRLTGVLGAGGAGQVFRAVWEPTDEQRAAAPEDHPPEVAVKLLRPDMLANEGLFNRFVREIGVAQSIHHPHILRHVDSGLVGDSLYYAMEVVPDGTLRDVLIKRGRLGWRDAVEAAMHVADALGALHDAGVVHRDLKPENVFLSEDGVLKLGDFGLARRDDAPTLTVSGQTVGSVRYMSPEQVRGRSDLDGRSDLYSLGCLMMEMLTGKAPFEEGDTMALFYKHVEEPPPKLRQRLPDAPEALEAFVDTLLQKDPGDRPATAGAARDILAALLESESGEIGPLGPRMGSSPARIEPLPEDESPIDTLSGVSDSHDALTLGAAPAESDADTPSLARRLAKPIGGSDPLLSPVTLLWLVVAVAVVGVLVLAGAGLFTPAPEGPTLIAP